MIKMLTLIGSLLGLLLLFGLVLVLLAPRMDRWGATDDEIAGSYPGDELVPDPARFINRAISIQASPAEIYPWIVQLGAEKGGWYSHTWLETNLLRCPMTNADHIHPEWQDLRVGDLVRMCPGESGPPPYIVAQIHPDQAIVLGHQEGGEWVDLYQFVLLPQPDGSTRLVLRTRTMMSGGFWSVISPGIFVMERGLLFGVKARAEALRGSADRQSGYATPTPEVFNPLDPSPMPANSDLPLTCQVTDLNVFIDRAAGYCYAYPRSFTLGDQPSDLPVVLGPVLDDGLDPVRVSLEVEVRQVDGATDLAGFVDRHLSTFGELPWEVQRDPARIGGEEAEILQPVPGRLSSREVLVLHDGDSFILRFHPVDLVIAREDLEALYQTVTGSFSFLEPPAP